ncbi:hypothetical protein NPIL_648221 [Nephila pilipes]|uniref:Uncharacterized protein n=1 Tax=Nephila pilipes TaxID=299642 RepID=A0A8X6QSB2_NEPPI|nr:hypothetical protein NPIL_648221 [Nephila pilipes]
MSTYSELERVFFSKYEQVRASNIPVDGNNLRKKKLEIATSNSIVTFSESNDWNSHFKICRDDVYADEGCLRVAEVVSDVKFSDYISIDQDVATCSILGIEEMYDKVKYISNGEEAEDNVHSEEAEPTPVQSLSNAITAFKTVQTYIRPRKHRKGLENCCKFYKFAI